MKKIPETEKLKLRIGEMVLVTTGDITPVKANPGLADRMLGEKNDGRIDLVYEGELLDKESNEYRQLCGNAYDEFREQFKNEESFEAGLKEIEKEYQTRLQQAEKRN